MNRGSAPFGSGYVSPSSSFNEAPIHESGKSAAFPGRLWPSGRFNEAPIHESGKCDEAARYEKAYRALQ